MAYNDPGKPYRPPNGEDGMIFMETFCDRCSKDITNACTILFGSLSYDIDDPEYPKEWVYDADRNPTCTAFEKLT
jgi:hypothetical protein